MSGAEFGIALAVFLACAVEVTELITIDLAVGMTRGWRDTLLGSGAGFAVVGAVVAVLGPSLALIPLSPLRIVVGALLLYFGAGWLRKAVLRHAGLKAKHDENAIYAREAEAALAEGRSAGFDVYAFTVAFKGTALELTEVAVIVLTLGAGHLAVASSAAVLAILVITALALAIRRPLAKVPENALKMAVGTMLVSFGVFWGAEGLGVAWPGADAALLVLVPLIGLSALGSARVLRARKLESSRAIA